MRFALAYTPINRKAFVLFGLGPRRSWVDVSPEEVVVRMGIGFRTTIPRPNITCTSLLDGRTISRGVHGWRGRWLVNAAGDGIVMIDIEPRVRAWTTGIPIRLRQLMGAVEEPAGLRRALEHPT